jgi:hypothetical protein
MQWQALVTVGIGVESSVTQWARVPASPLPLSLRSHSEVCGRIRIHTLHRCHPVLAMAQGAAQMHGGSTRLDVAELATLCADRASIALHVHHYHSDVQHDGPHTPQCAAAVARVSGSTDKAGIDSSVVLQFLKSCQVGSNRPVRNGRNVAPTRISTARPLGGGGSREL